MTIDSHVHFWKYDKRKDAWITDRMKILQQHYYPEHLQPTLKRNGIDGVVAIQTDQSELETHFLNEMAATHSFIKGVVGWVDLRKDNCAERLQYFSQYPIIKGWRHIVQAEATGFLKDEKFLAGIALLQTMGYTYDLLIYPHQLEEAADFTARFPEQKFVLDHGAKPEIRDQKINEWKAGIRALAAHPNTCCKLSGLFTEARWKDWRAGEFYPYLDVLVEAFGTQRLLFGSDWPVILLSGIYVQWKSLIEKYFENLPIEEMENIMGNNAFQFYNL